jgi:hypothetical protein
MTNNKIFENCGRVIALPVSKLCTEFLFLVEIFFADMIAQSEMGGVIFNYFCLVEMLRSAKKYISTARGSTSGGTRSFLRNFFAQTLHLARMEAWRSDFNKVFGIVHFEHQTIENTALPATWLHQALYSFFRKYRKFSKFGLVFLRRLQSKQPNPTNNGRTGHFYEFQRGNIVPLKDSTDDLAHDFFFNSRPVA